MADQADEARPDEDRRHLPDRRVQPDRRQLAMPPPADERRSGSDRRQKARRRSEILGSHSREEKQAALEITEQILVSLRREPDPDYALRELIQSIENEQALLVASLLDDRGRGPRR